MRKFFGKIGPVFIAAALALQMSPVAFADTIAGTSTPLDITEMLKATPDSITETAESDAVSDITDATLFDEGAPIVADTPLASTGTQDATATADSLADATATTDSQAIAAAADEQSAASPEDPAVLDEEAREQKVDTLDPEELGYIPGELIVAYRSDVPEAANPNVALHPTIGNPTNGSNVRM